MNNLAKVGWAFTALTRAEANRTGRARSIADLIVADLPVPAFYLADYKDASVALVAAQDAYLAAVDAMDEVG